MFRWRTLFILVVLVLIVVANIGLWTSPEVPGDVKRRLTTLNAIGWGVVLLPAIGVAFWLKTHRGRDKD